MTSFEGFPRDIVAFLAELAENNSREWFEDNRERYESVYREPARAFVAAMADPLAEIADGVHADPGNNGSIMRINRDTRFSADKSPYNAYLRIMFWQGSGKPRESSAFYFGLEPGVRFVGGGMYGFTPRQLARYRAALHTPSVARALEQAIRSVEMDGNGMCETHLKRTPAGVDVGHPHEKLFRYKGLYAGARGEVEDWLFGNECIAHVAQRFRSVRPLQGWLAKNVAR